MLSRSDDIIFAVLAVTLQKTITISSGIHRSRIWIKTFLSRNVSIDVICTSCKFWGNFIKRTFYRLNQRLDSCPKQLNICVARKLRNTISWVDRVTLFDERMERRIGGMAKYLNARINRILKNEEYLVVWNKSHTNGITTKQENCLALIR